MMKSLLIANRGEIACRVIRTAQRLGIRAVAVYSDADAKALHVRMADEAVHIGPSPARESYLVGEKIIAAAKATGAEAIHPGYGFLSENADFAQAVIDAGLIWVGPKPASIRAMGLKDAAKKLMTEAGVPVTPGYLGENQDPKRLKKEADAIGYPVLIKAVSGGGGKGMRRVDEPGQFDDALESAKREAASAFGDDRLYIEKFLEKPRHVEIQVFADEHGNAIHLGERECSVQRRQQKVIEESPSCVLDERLREAMGEVAVRAAKAVDYRGAGTVEFLVDAHRDFYFLEMNTRLQVEHPVTEMLTGLDLVRMQIEVAQGQRIIEQEQVVRRGHAIEARIYAEDPARGFLPSPGKITYLRLPGGPGIRDDSGVYTGWTVPQFYDPLISKLVAWAPTRPQAIERLIRALGDYTVHGITTNVAYLTAALGHPAFRSGEYDTSFCARYAKDLVQPPDPRFEQVALIAAAVAAFKRDHDQAEAFAARAGMAAAARSRWAQLGRARGLRGGGR
jgi:acetyl-CoA carboxylase biotin carboxylase subunit